MNGIELQLLYGIRIELDVDSLPYLARVLSSSLSMSFGSTQITLSEEKGVLQTCQSLGRKEKSQFRDNSITDLGLGQKKQNETNNLKSTFNTVKI
jgi:hypothetical protein